MARRQGVVGGIQLLFWQHLCRRSSPDWYSPMWVRATIIMNHQRHSEAWEQDNTGTNHAAQEHMTALLTCDSLLGSFLGTKL